MKLVSTTKNYFPKRLPVGIYSREILCKRCDHWIGRELDEYAYKHLLSEGPCKIIRKNSRDFGYIYENIEAFRIKRFYLSVLWRAANSKHRMFSRLKLGRYGPLALSAMNGDEQALSQFEVFVQEFDSYRALLNPAKVRLDGVNVVKLYVNKFLVFVKLDQRQFYGPRRKFQISRGERVVHVAKSLKGSSEYDVMLDMVRKYPNLY